MEGNMQVLQGINTLIDSFKKNVYNKQRPPAKNLELNKYV